MDVRESGHQRLAVVGLELAEFAAVDQPHDDLVHVVGHPRIRRHDVVELGLCVLGLDRAARTSHWLGSRGPKVAAIDADDPQRVFVVVGEVVGDTGHPRVQVAAAELLGRDDLAGGGLHQRRTAEKDRALLADDDGLVAHRRHVGAARRARAQYRRHLRNALGAHGRLVVEDPPEMLAVGKHLVLARQEGAAGVDEVDARQPILQRDLLCAQVLLDRHRVVGAALDRRVVGDDHALAPGHPADPGDDPGSRGLVVVHTGGGQRRQLQERAARIEQAIHPFAGQQLAAADVTFPRAFIAAQRRGRELGVQFIDQPAVLVGERRRRTGLVTASSRMPPGCRQHKGRFGFREHLVDRHPGAVSTRCKPSSHTSMTARSVMMRFTHATPVNGSVHRSTTFGLPSLAVCSLSIAAAASLPSGGPDPARREVQTSVNAH